MIDGLLARLGTGALAKVQGLATGAPELDSDPVLTRQLSTQAFPAQVNTAGLGLKTNRVHQVIGKHRDEQVPADALGLVVKNWA